jgi:predicted carbohydrate-binding protein with CBM5 and CBM33 domain
MQAFIATLVLLAAHLSHVSGHAFMSDPAARQYQNYKQTGEMGDDAEPMTAYGGRT